MMFLIKREFGSWALRIFIYASLGMVGLVQAQMTEAKIKDVGLGFTLSSGQSFFYMRGTNPYNLHQVFYSVGLHIEEEGFAIPTYNNYGYPERNVKQSLYLETSIGWRRLWFKDKLAGGFFPHTTVELGGVGFFDDGGTLANYMRDISLTWAPAVGVGFGGTVFSKTSIIRFEMGLLSTIGNASKVGYPHYSGAFLRVSMSNWERPGSRRR